MFEYFELFDIPVQLEVDKTKLARRYFELSKQYHPDYFANASGHEQDEALEKTAMLNKALKTFKDTDETIRYVLTEKGLMQEEEKFQLPPDFLMEMMEVNEQLAEAKMEDDQEEIKKIAAVIDRINKDIYAPVQNIVEQYQEAVTTDEELLQVKTYYYKKKYLQRIRRQLNGKL